MASFSGGNYENVDYSSTVITNVLIPTKKIVDSTNEKLNTAYIFGGANFINYTSDAVAYLDNQTQFTVTSKIKPTAYNTAVSTNGIENVFISNNGNFEVGYNNSGELMIYLKTLSRDTYSVITGATLNLNEENTIAISYNGVFTININGTEVTNNDWAIGITNIATTGSSLFYLGNTVTGPTNLTGMIGEISYVNFYSTFMSLSEAQASPNELTIDYSTATALNSAISNPSSSDVEYIFNPTDGNTTDKVSKKGVFVSSVGTVFDFTNNTESTSDTTWGYWLEDSGYNSTWISGVETAQSVIDNLRVLGSETTLTFSGKVIGSISSGLTTIDYDANNSVNFNFTFGSGTNTFTGDMAFNAGGETWSSTFSGTSTSGVIFSTTSISGTGNGSAITSGNVAGKFFGSTTQSGVTVPKEVGGAFSLTTGSNTANGVFLAQ